MKNRTAAIIIDNFLSDDQWNHIQKNITSYLKSDTFVEDKGELYSYIIFNIKQKLKSLDIWREHWNSTVDMWSYLNSLPAGIDRESSSNNGGYHSEFG